MPVDPLSLIQIATTVGPIVSEMFRKPMEYTPEIRMNSNPFMAMGGELDPIKKGAKSLSLYQQVMQKLVEEKGGTPEDYENIMNKIAYHESKLIPDIKQLSGGPGRGLFQYEVGKGQRGIVALRRTKKYLEKAGLEVPDWVKENISKDSFDASTLSPEQQKILFIGDYREHPKANLGDVVSGKKDITDFWLDYHWVGKGPNDSDRAIRKKSFQKSLKHFEKNYPELEKITDNTKKEVREKIEDPLLDEGIKFLEKTKILNKTKKLANGGSLEVSNFKQYDAGMHGTGMDHPVDSMGNVNFDNPVAKIQGEENSYNNYVYSDTLENPYTGNTFNLDMKKLVKKYKNADLSIDEKNALDFEAANLSKINEKVKDAKLNSLLDNVSSILARGGQLPEYTFGGYSTGLMAYLKSLQKPVDTLPNTTNPLQNKNITVPRVGNKNVDTLPQNLDFELPERSIVAMFNDDRTFNSKLKEDNEKPDISIPDIMRTAALTKDFIDTLRPAEQESPILPDYSTADRRMNSMNIDLQSAKNSAISAYNAIMQDINNNPRSESVRNARMMQATSGKANALANISAQEMQMRNQIAGTQGNYEAQKALQAAQILMQNRINNQQNRAAKFQAGERFVNDILGLSQQITREEIAEKTSAEMAALLGLKYENFALKDRKTFDKMYKKLQRGEITPEEFRDKANIEFK